MRKKILEYYTMSFYYNIFYSYIISCYLKKKKNTKIHSVVMVTDSYI